MIELSKLFNLLLSIPLGYLYTVSIGNKDVINGYGWHRIAYVSIHAIGEKCRKCGWSTIDGTQKDFDNSRHRHFWQHDEKCILSKAIYTEKDIEELETFINGLKK